MRSGEAVQRSAKANANGMELVDLENVIGTIHAQGLTEGPFLAKPSARASGASKNGGPRWCELRWPAARPR